MAVVRYTAKRSLTAGVSVNDTVTLDVNLRDSSARGRRVQRSVSTAMDGTRESVYDRGESVWNLVTQIVYTTDRDAYVMFLDSVEDGQTFEFAPYNTTADSPIDYRNVQVLGDGYQENREAPIGAGAGDGFSFALSIVEVP